MTEGNTMTIKNGRLFYDTATTVEPLRSACCGEQLRAMDDGGFCPDCGLDYDDEQLWAQIDGLQTLFGNAEELAHLIVSITTGFLVVDVCGGPIDIDVPQMAVA